MDLNRYILDLQQLIKFNSVQSSPEPNAPFGKEVQNCLLTFLRLAEEYGFETVNYDGYAGEIIFGEGEELGILCHLDIVPVGSLEDWKTPPFTLTCDQEKLIGRGVLDNKGPALTILHALKDLKAEGYQPNKKIRLILGCNEESGWGCISHLKSLGKMPSFGFSPDAEFPVIYAEKGILHVEFLFQNNFVEFISGGKASNMVCDYVECKTQIDEALAKKHQLIVKNGLVISYGKTAHGSTPHKGKNAIKNMLEYLADMGFVSQEIIKNLFYNGTKIKDLQDETGNLTLSPNIISCGDNVLKILCDIRYPATLKKSFVLSQLEKIAPFKVLSYQPPLFVDKQNKLVKTLSKVYGKVTGEDFTPIAIGGGTYARSMSNCVAFGPVFKEQHAVCHEPNEYVLKKDLLLSYKIYKEAIKSL